MSKTLLRETIDWTLQPLESKADLTKILNHQKRCLKNHLEEDREFFSPLLKMKAVMRIG